MVILSLLQLSNNKSTQFIFYYKSHNQTNTQKTYNSATHLNYNSSNVYPEQISHFCNQ